MKIDGYCLKWNNIVIVFKKIDNNIPSKENPFPQITSWEGIDFYIEFHRNVMPSKIVDFFKVYKLNEIPFYFFAKPNKPFDIPFGDKIPVRNLNKLAKLETKLINNEEISLEDIISIGVLPKNDLDQNNFLNSDSGHFSQNSSGSNSLISIPSIQSPAPTIDLNKTNCVTNLFSKESNNHLESRRRIKIESRRIKKIYNNKFKNTKDIVLSKEDSFLDGIAKHRIKTAISFRECVRVSNITKTEMLILEDSPKKPMILGNRIN